MSDHIQFFQCPNCHLLQSRLETVETSEHWSEWRCWDCGYVFGGISDRGTLDLGFISDGPTLEGVFTETYIRDDRNPHPYVDAPMSDRR